MSGQIFRANYTERNQYGSETTFQYAWQWTPSRNDCYRPTPDFGMPIACKAYGNSLDWKYNQTAEAIWEQQFQDFATFSLCCPQLPPRNVTNQYMMNRRCQSSMCFTFDEEVAKGFNECVKKHAKEKFEKDKREGRLPANLTLANEASGRCEYVDYEMLRNPKKSGALKKGVLSLQALTVVGLVVTILGSSMM